MSKGGLLKQLYQKQRKRVLNYISRARKKGYTFDIEIPPIPKNPTKKDVNFFTNITPEKLRENGYYVSEETGEVEQAQEAFKRKRKEAAQKAALTRKRVDADEFYEELNGSTFVIQQLEYLMDSLNNPVMQRFYRRSQNARIVSEQKAKIVLDVLNNTIEKDGINVVANRIATNFSEVEQSIDRMLYGYRAEEVNSGYTSLIRIIKGGAITSEEAKMIGEAEDEDFEVF